MLPDSDTAEICWAARQKMFKLTGWGILPFWEILPEWRRQVETKVIQGARNGLSPRQTHQGWRDEMADHGCRYGPMLDITRGINPFIKPWDELEERQKVIWRSIHMLVLGMTVNVWADYTTGPLPVVPR